jgi:tetratricopeptide (TPR) repeat protein
MRAFIVRPFGVKKGVDFDAVERELINPALDALDITGRTTGEIVAPGNIREDMFRLLLTADLVVADMSVHNANVFYELGIRHSLREKRTFLIRAAVDDTPFDLLTDRYLRYDPEHPAASKDALIAGIRDSLASESQDSPVFRLLPGLEAQDPGVFRPVPRGFQEEVTIASAKQFPGDLALLAQEALGFEWEMEGARLVARAQFQKKDMEGARITWEAIRDSDPSDLEANLALGTIYQRLGDLTQSDLALKRALEGNVRRKSDRAEAYALQGRNAKARWLTEWRSAPADAWRQKALQSPFLKQAYDRYASAFSEDLNHFYSGLNALGLLVVMVELGAAYSDIWESMCDDDVDGPKQLELCRRQRDKLAGAVELSLKAAKARLDREGRKDIWAEISQADLATLTAVKPNRVAVEYRAALTDAMDFNASSVRDQLQIYLDLGVCADNAKAALAELPSGAGVSAATPKRVLLFTGHRIDEDKRPSPRFPKDKELPARDAIRMAVQEELAKAGEIAYGIAGGASGGDILFHEVCQELQISTRLYLALPAEKFIVHSVAAAGPQWIERFNALLGKLVTRVLQQTEALPAWLAKKSHYGVWQRDNFWMLHNALAYGATKVTLIALWDGAAGDGPGGTADLVAQARKRGAKVVILDTKALFGLQ